MVLQAAATVPVEQYWVSKDASYPYCHMSMIEACPPAKKRPDLAVRIVRVTPWGMELPGGRLAAAWQTSQSHEGNACPASDGGRTWDKVPLADPARTPCQDASALAGPAHAPPQKRPVAGGPLPAWGPVLLWDDARL
eukprot:gene9642-8604_t